MVTRMGYRSLRQALMDLERHGQLRRIDVLIDPHLEAAEIQRRVYAAKGPALFFANVKGPRFRWLVTSSALLNALVFSSAMPWRA